LGSHEVILLDTHVLVWAVAKDRKLGRKARALIAKEWDVNAVAVSAISFWEVGMLQARGRLHLDTPMEHWRNELLDSGLIELPLDGAVAVRSLDFAEFSEDPADRFIAATALLHSASLLTADEKMLGWKHVLNRVDAQL
jgi:PIN domain nuclease of toxin-antitoxin system